MWIDLKVSQIDLLAKFLSLLTERMRSAVGKLSRVIWYDAVTAEGKLKWQNELNDRNEYVAFLFIYSSFN